MNKSKITSWNHIAHENNDSDEPNDERWFRATPFREELNDAVEAERKDLQ